MLGTPAVADRGAQTVVARYLMRRRNQLGTRWRKLAPGAQAVIVLAVLRHDQRLADMAGGNHVSTSTVRRWVLEVLTLPSACAPRLDRALKKIARRGGAVGRSAPRPSP